MGSAMQLALPCSKKMWRTKQVPPKMRTFEFGNPARSEVDQAALSYRKSNSFRREIRSK